MGETEIAVHNTAELLMNALANMSDEGGYAVRHSKHAVSDFCYANDPAGVEPSPNYSLMAFPSLFPFGRGGIEQARPLKVSFKEHVRWCLEYYDRRFRTHHSFPFVMFGIEQKREAFASAKVQVSRKDFERDLPVISQLTVDDLKLAASEREAGHNVSNPVIARLFKHVRVTSSRIMGTDPSRAAVRSQTWSTGLFFAPATLWVTINLADIHDPIAQLFAGEEIDMDQFNAMLGAAANDVHRAQNIANDPYAVAKYFHVVVLIVLEELFGITRTSKNTTSIEGIFGEVAAYIGMVESQNRATLHLHILFWLKGAPDPEELLEKLKTESFRERMRAFIAQNIKAHCSGIDEDTI